MNLNKVILIGRISLTPISFDSKSSSSKIVKFNLAINRDFNGLSQSNEITDFIPLVAFGNIANYILRFFDKGDLVSIVGSLQSSTYINRDGNNVNSVNVVIDQIKQLEPLNVIRQRRENYSSKLNNEQPLHDDLEKDFFAPLQQDNNQALDKDIDEINDDSSPWEIDI